MQPYLAFIGIICCCLVGLAALFGIILFIPFCCLIVYLVVIKPIVGSTRCLNIIFNRLQSL